jgi:RNA polymerase sigma factor (sigma-70 family)
MPTCTAMYSTPLLTSWLTSLYMAEETSRRTLPDGDSDILEQAQSDPRRFAPIYERYFSDVYKYCLRRTGDREEAEDLASLIFTRALTGARSYRGGSVRAWLFRIAHNAVANYLRDRHPTLSVDEPGGRGAWELADPAEDTLGQIVRQEERNRVAALVRRLPDDQRELLALRMAGGLSAKDIGAVLGKQESTVRVALHRIVRSLQAAYRDSTTEQDGETEVTL